MARKTELLGPAQRAFPYGDGMFVGLAADHSAVYRDHDERAILVVLLNAKTKAGLFLGMSPRDATVFAEGILDSVAKLGPPKKDGLE